MRSFLIALLLVATSSVCAQQPAWRYLRRAIRNVPQNGHVILEPSDEPLLIPERIRNVDLDSDITIEGNGNTVMRSGVILQLFAKINARPTIVEDVTLYDRTIVVDSIEGIELGDIINFESSLLSETSWNSPANDTWEIVAIDPSTKTLHLSGPTNFQYATGDIVNVRVFDAPTVTIRNLRFSSELGVPRLTNENSLLALRGCKVRLEGVTFANPNNAITQREFLLDGARLSFCHDVLCTDTTFQAVYYGLTINSCSNVVVRDGYSWRVRHPVTPGRNSSNITVDTHFGADCDSITDGHAVFNLAYRNIRGTQRQNPNARGWGISYKDVDIRVTADEPPPGRSYFGWPDPNTDNATDFPHIRTDYDIKIDNFNLIHKLVQETAGRHNGVYITVPQRSVSVRDSRIHSVQFGPHARLDRSLFISDSCLGYLANNNAKTLLSNVVMDKTLLGHGVVFAGGFLHGTNVRVINFDGENDVLFNNVGSGNTAALQTFNGGEITIGRWSRQGNTNRHLVTGADVRIASDENLRLENFVNCIGRIGETDLTTLNFAEEESQ